MLSYLSASKERVVNETSPAGESPYVFHFDDLRGRDHLCVASNHKRYIILKQVHEWIYVSASNATRVRKLVDYYAVKASSKMEDPANFDAEKSSIVQVQSVHLGI